MNAALSARKWRWLIALGLVCGPAQLQPARGFEGRITAVLTRGGVTQTWVYTVRGVELRIERAETNWAHGVNLVRLDSEERTLVFPHNRSFVRLKAAEHRPLPSEATPGGSQPTLPSPPSGIGAIPRPPVGPPPGAGSPFGGAPPAGVGPLPPGIGPRAGPAGPGPDLSLAGLLAMAPPMIETLELRATGQKTNLLGLACERFELQQRDQVMEIWATDRLIAFEPYQAQQLPRFSPRLLEERWGELLREKKLFPLRAVLSWAGGGEWLRFEVRSVREEKIRDDAIFAQPEGYHELHPLPF